MTYWFHVLNKPQHHPLQHHPTVSCSLDTFDLAINCIPSGKSVYYRPQTKFAKVLFSQASVILSGGGGSASSEGLHPGWSASGGGGLHPREVWIYGGSASKVCIQGGWADLHQMLWDMVNEWAIRMDSCLLLFLLLISSWDFYRIQAT